MILFFLSLFFRCPHEHTTWPLTSKGSRCPHVTCLSCGREFFYDWKEMKIKNDSLSLGSTDLRKSGSVVRAVVGRVE